MLLRLSDSNNGQQDVPGAKPTPQRGLPIWRFLEREVLWMAQKRHDIKRSLAVLEYAEDCGNMARTCRHRGISRQ